MSMDDQLKKEIEAGAKLAKVVDPDAAKKEAEKKKRAEELKILQEKMKASGQWKDEEAA